MSFILLQVGVLKANCAPAAAEKRVHYRRDELEDYRNAKSQAERDIIIKRKGGKPL